MIGTKAATRRTLVKARALIRDPKDWIQGTAARDVYGMHASALSAGATRFCAVGAVRRVSKLSLLDTEYKLATLALQTALKGGSVSIFNDRLGRKHSEVIAVFDRAIEANQ